LKLKLDHLNPQQYDATTTVSGPLLILAGAGTGKTGVITCRIAYLISQGIDPENILAVTFTNKAATEMKERVANLVSRSQAAKLTIGTFHSFCIRILRHKIHMLGYSRNFGIATEAYQIGLLRSIMSELGYAGNGMTKAQGGPSKAGDYLSAISCAKSALIAPDEYPRDNPISLRIAEVYEAYQKQMKSMDLVDFDDLLGLVLELWHAFPDILAEHQEKYRYILIDEYQDTNAVQFELMATLTRPKNNICAVGDDDQSIYGWRGADVDNILGFDKHFPGTKIIRLEQNYRSSETILNSANQVIALNRNRHPKQLWSQKGRGKNLLEIRCKDELEEAQVVTELIQERHINEGHAYEDFAILYRSNHQSRTFETALRRAKVPHHLIGSQSFYERREVLDALSFLQAVLNPKDDLSLLRIINVPPRGIGGRSLERLREMRTLTALPLQQLLASDTYLEELPTGSAGKLRQFNSCLLKFRKQFQSQSSELAESFKQLLDEIGYLEGLGKMYKPREDALRRQENVFEFIAAVAEFEKRRGPGKTMQDVVESFALMDSNDRDSKDDEEKDPGVTLMTVHASKGLEFPVVAVVGLEHGLFPHQNSLDTNNLEEERRLFYVAATRAQSELILTHVGTRNLRGQNLKRRPSVFVSELPEDLVDFYLGRDALKPASKETAEDMISQMKAMFAKGK
jgi:superfamily I DNA/RNA helicase